MNLTSIKKQVWKDIATSWPFAMLCLGLSVLLILSICFASLNLVFIKTETGTTTLLTQETEPAKILDKAGIDLTENHTYDINNTGLYNEINVYFEDDNTVVLANETSAASNVDNKSYAYQSSATSYYDSSVSTSVTISEPALASEAQENSTVTSNKDTSSEEVKPELSDDARLASLKLSKGKLSPSFKQSTYKYTATVDNSVKSIKVTATASDSKAQIDISGDGSLDIGENTIKIIVTAQDDKTTKTYRIIVTREKAESSEPEESKPEDNDSDDNSSEESKPEQSKLTNYDFDPVSELKAPKIYVDEQGQPLKYIKKYSGKCTAYYNPNGNLTATGRVFKPGHIAVNPKKIPYGTKMYVVSPKGGFVYGYSIAADTGGFANNGSGTLVDLAFWTKKECNNFGRRTMNVYILEY